MEPKNEEQKSSKFFHCECCDYVTSRKSQFDRHLLTDKHNFLINPNKKVPDKIYTCECGKEYKHQTTLCAHKKNNCKYKKTNDQSLPENIIMNVDDDILPII